MPTQTRNPHFTIRPATIEDAGLILRFIRELADYEKLLHEVIADEATLKQSLFGETPHAKVLIGEYNGVAVSFALYFHNFSTFLGRPGIYLEDLYVQPTMRGKGLGKILLGYLASLAIELNCGRLEWWVLDWNKPAIDFYQSLGAQPMDEWTVNRVAGEALGKLAKQL
jgi:GNAT superfamily N-acetyltransferase|tara:strand:+ start:3371 stop:3874 length:504 start_codon:yes stop_codon:yes gene_type:complete